MTSKLMRLYRKKELLGVISNITPEDNFEMSGDIELTESFSKYQPLFDYLHSNDGLTPGGKFPFEEALFDDWEIEDESGQRTAIAIPAIEAGEIIWRE